MIKINSMKKIVAVYKKKKLKTNWGFIFNTDIQMYVEGFMQKIHVGVDEYILWFEEEKPNGVYTEVSVKPIYDVDGSLIDTEYIF